MANEQNLKPFVKGDPRINRKGRPKSFDALRKLAQQIAIEPAMVKDKATGQDVPLVINNAIVTQIEALLRQMIRDPKRSALFLEYAYGKDKVQMEHTGKDGGPVQNEVILKVVFDDGINSTPETPAS